MRLLVVGSGAREHAVAAALRRSPQVEALFAAPGNPGMETLAVRTALDLKDHGAVIGFCRLMRIDLVVIGPEAPLVEGLVDDLEAAGVAAFGPTKAAARLEGSKGFTKDLCRECGIPTAPYRRFASLRDAEAYLEAHGAPIVVKADGLAAGKGVTVAASLEEARSALAASFSGAFGPQSEVVLEEVLEGEEASFFAFCDGERARPFATAQDHKRAFEGDLGPNTGGMGAYSPAPIVTEAMTERVMREIVEPALGGMRRRGSPFKGVLFAGLMIGPSGPALIEFNVRFGDPEAQAILPRFEGDLAGLMLACARGRLDEAPPPRFSQRSGLAVVLAAEGYPEAPRVGGLLSGLDLAAGCPDVRLFQAGVRKTPDGLAAAGGRVLTVTGLGDNLTEARARAYAAIERVSLPGGFYRKDIGWRALAKGV